MQKIILSGIVVMTFCFIFTVPTVGHAECDQKVNKAAQQAYNYYNPVRKISISATEAIFDVDAYNNHYNWDAPGGQVVAHCEKDKWRGNSDGHFKIYGRK